MKKKHLLFIVAALIILNIVTATVLFIKTKDEFVATIGDEKISRQEWLNEMEDRFGESALKDLVDQKVILQMANKYNISISEKEIDHELTLIKTSSYLEDQNETEEKLREQIKHSLLLEELLTKDVAVSSGEMKKYYQDNKELFVIPTSYELSQIIVNTKKEAEQTSKELKQGSSFEALAMERSIDEFSRNQGGKIGYVKEEEEGISPDNFSKIKQLKPGTWTKPLKTDEGYVIYLLHERVPEKKYSYKEVKNQIRRQIALDQMDVPVSADLFWEEARVDWFYEKDTGK